MPEFFLVLVLFGQGANTSMTTMPKTYAETQCRKAGENWVYEAGPLRRTYHCIPMNGFVK